MKTLLCFGLGYSASAYIAEYGVAYGRIVGTVRGAEKRDRLASAGIAGRKIETLIFDGGTASDDVAHAAGIAEHVIVSVAPGESGDRVMAVFGDALRQSGKLQSVAYLSTVGVYGDYGGAIIDETAELRTVSARSLERIAAEKLWQAFGEETGVPVALLRLSGIYGPSRNALVDVALGSRKRVVKPGQVFNRIHCADIAQAISGVFARKASGAFNVSDDEPSPPQDVIAYAAQLLGLPLPEEIPFDVAKATMSPMAQSFYSECKRIDNRKMKAELGVSLRYPNYRAGLDALFAAGDFKTTRSPVS